MSEKLEIRGRTSIHDLYQDKRFDEMPKYGDFLVRYTSSEIHGENFLIVEIFKEMTDDGIVSCLVWWNFRDERGNLEPLQDERHSYCMGVGCDTYKANNYEIQFLIEKLKEVGYGWDFESKQLIRI
jgi:hypothetical protein